MTLSPSHLVGLGWLPIACALALGAVTPRASAQDALAEDEAARRVDLARTLFSDGVTLVGERRFEEAEAHFRQALALHEAPSIRANLASVLYEQGEYPEAAALAESVLSDTAAPEASTTTARTVHEQVGARAGFARIVGTPSDGVVRVDGFTVAPDAGELPIAPGAHAAALSIDGEERAHVAFTVTAGEHVNVTLEAPVVVAAVVLALVEPAATETWWFWTAVGGGVAVVAVAIGVGVAVATTGSAAEPALLGDFEPGVLRW